MPKWQGRPVSSWPIPEMVVSKTSEEVLVRPQLKFSFEPLEKGPEKGKEAVEWCRAQPL